MIEREQCCILLSEHKRLLHREKVKGFLVGVTTAAFAFILLMWLNA